MSQRVLVVEALPQGALEASTAFVTDHLAAARAMLAEPGTQALAIVLPSAPSDHDDWRRTLARDLARAHRPRRVNVIGGSAGEACDAALAFLANAPGVTGQHLPLED